MFDKITTLLYWHYVDDIDDAFCIFKKRSKIFFEYLNHRKMLPCKT